MLTDNGCAVASLGNCGKAYKNATLYAPGKGYGFYFDPTYNHHWGRHLEGDNVAFADDHVKWLKAAGQFSASYVVNWIDKKISWDPTYQASLNTD